MLLKRSAFALAFLFVEYILEWIVFWGVTDATNVDTAWKVKSFLPLESMWKLIDQPIQRIVMSINPDKEELLYDYAVHWYEILIVLGWTAVFIFLSYRLLKKRDL